MVKVYNKVVLFGVFFFLLIGFSTNLRAQCSGLDFSVTVRKGCVPLPVRFAATGFSSGSTFRWDLGSGYVNWVDTITKLYTFSGKYRIKLEVTPSGASGPCAVIVKDTFITVFPTPTPVIDINPGTNICNRSNYALFTDNTANAFAREWIIEGNSFKDAKVPYIFASTGSKQVLLNATNKYNCTGYANTTVNVFDSVPVDFCANISVNPNTTNAPVKVKFNAVTGYYYPRKIAGYTWQFPGSTSVTYTTPGSPSSPVVVYPDNTKKYDVTLTITMDDGCSYTIYRKGFVSPFLSPAFQSKCANQKLVFSADLSDTGRHFYGFQFPGAYSVELPMTPDPKSATVLYKTADLFDAVVTYKYKGLGCTVSIRYTNFITITGPLADFKSSDNQICKGTDTVHFTNLSNTLGAPNVKYTWYFFDSNDKLLKKHNSTKDTFWSPGATGQYGVGLVAVSTNGCKDSTQYKSHYITTGIPQADFVVNNPVGCFNGTGTVVLTGKPNPPEGKIITNTYTWQVTSDVDPSVTAKANGNVYAFTPPILGSYSVYLSISNGRKCMTDTTKKGVFNVIGDITSLNISQTQGCLSPNFITHVSVGKEKISPNDPNNPPLYHWYTDPLQTPYCTFQDPYASSTDVVITKSGCYNVFLDIATYLGTDTCKETLSRKDNYGICVGSGIAFYEDPFKCIGDTINIYNVSNPGLKNLKWSVSPKQYAKILPTDTSHDIRIIFNKDVCYKITLAGEKLINGKICRDSFVDDNLCLIQPKASFYTTSPTFYCAPSIGRFYSTSSNAVSYTWHFGDGDSINTQVDSVVHAYLTLPKNQYDISLTAIDKNGCSNTITQKSVVKVVGPVPEFTMDKKVGCDSVLVHFVNKSTHVNKFDFFLDDGNTTPPNQIPALHKYYLQDSSLDSIIYNPVLLSADDITCKVFYRDTLKLYRTPTDVIIKPDVTLGCTPLTVHFNVLSRTANRWACDFDGTGIKDSIHKNPVFTFTKPGKYRVKLTATNHGQCPNDFYSDTIFVTPNALAGFMPSVTRFCGKQTISFKNTSKDYARFEMDYGDGTPWDSNVINNHTYIFDPNIMKGDSVQFISRLIAFNAAGCSDTFKKTITGYIMPVAGFKSSVVSGCSPLKVHFTDTSTNGFGSQWDFDNNGTIDAYGKSVDWTFSPGIYTVKLISFTRNGCIDSIVKLNMIEVNDPPKPDFAVSDSEVCYKGGVHFTNLTRPAQEVVYWLWQFGDPGAPYNSSTQKEPTFRYYSKGYHSITLTAIDTKGCAGAIKKTAVYVDDTLPPPNSNLIFVTVKDTHTVTISWRKNKSKLFKGYRINRIENGHPLVIYAPLNETDTSFEDTNDKINTSGQSYCYSLQTVNACDNVSFASYSHCTILLSENALPGPANVLNWTSYRGWQPNYYRIYRADASGIIKKIDSVDGGTLTYTDSALCDETYCYYVEAVKDSGIISKSNTTCLHALYTHFTNPLYLNDVTDINEKQIKISWEKTTYKNLDYYTIDKYNLYSGWIKDYAKTKDSFFIDNNVLINDHNYNYKVRAVDKCNYTNAQSNSGSSILLNLEVHKDNVNLKWNAYRTWKAGVQKYKVQIQQRNKNFRTIATLADTSFIDDSVYNAIDTAYCYRIVAMANPSGQDSSVSNKTCAVLPSRIFVPNAFTPGNNDSVNDVWKVSAISIYNAIGPKLYSFNAKIFNRWGILVFETNDLNKGWDGTFKGGKVPVDAYIYIIDAEGIDGRHIHLNGNITVVK